MKPLREQALNHPLPGVTDQFLKELSKVATRDGKPMFKLVDGMHELHYRRGKMTIKHPLQQPAFFVKVAKVRYRRKYHGSDNFKLYISHAEAKADKEPHLSTVIETATKESVVAVGRPCWIVEVYIAPSEIDEATWNSERYQTLEKNGIYQTIDSLGSFPKDGYYIGCFDVISPSGNACSPSDKTLDECRRRWKLALGDTRTAEEAIQGDHEAIKKFEQKTLDTMNANVFDYHGPTVMSRARGGVTGKPIMKVKG